MGTYVIDRRFEPLSPTTFCRSLDSHGKLFLSALLIFLLVFCFPHGGENYLHIGNPVEVVRALWNFRRKLAGRTHRIGIHVSLQGTRPNQRLVGIYQRGGTSAARTACRLPETKGHCRFCIHCAVIHAVWTSGRTWIRGTCHQGSRQRAGWHDCGSLPRGTPFSPSCAWRAARTLRCSSLRLSSSSSTQ